MRKPLDDSGPCALVHRAWDSLFTPTRHNIAPLRYRGRGRFRGCFNDAFLLRDFNDGRSHDSSFHQALNFRRDIQFTNIKSEFVHLALQAYPLSRVTDVQQLPLDGAQPANRNGRYFMAKARVERHEFPPRLNELASVPATLEIALMLGRLPDLTKQLLNAVAHRSRAEK